MNRIHVRWLDARTGRAREVRFSPWWFITPLVLAGIMIWILAAVLHSSRSPEKLRQHIEDLRSSNAQLEANLTEASARRRSILTALGTVKEELRDLPATPGTAGSVLRRPDLVDGNGIDSLLTRARKLREDMDHADGACEKHAADLIRLPTIRPVSRSWPVVENFGPSTDLFTSHRWLQQGTVIATPTGTRVWATGAGTVTDVQVLPRWGLIVEINHHNGFQTICGHLQSVQVRRGQNVLRGQIIGFSGSSGRVTAPQIFYAVFYRGRALDPQSVLLPSPRTRPAFLDSGLFRLPTRASTGVGFN